MKKLIKPIIILIIIIISLLFALILLLTVFDYNPELKEEVEIIDKNSRRVSSTISLLNWNLGYGGLGKDMDFFMDGGTQVRLPEDEYIINRNGILDFIKKTDSDIYLFQEIDRRSTRSYNDDQYFMIKDLLIDYSSSFATNYKVKFIPPPKLLAPSYGSVFSGLAVYSKYQITNAYRYSLPGNYKWPKRVFFLDRCMLISRIATDNGSEVILINIHTSAYDKGGFLKIKQLNYIKEYGENEYKKGNYVIIGGDWNSFMPGTKADTFPSEEEAPIYYKPLPENWSIDKWKWGIDTKTPTNRSLKTAYIEKITFTSVIDGFLVSPNISVKEVSTYNLEFKYSDHNPTKIILELD